MRRRARIPTLVAAWSLATTPAAFAQSIVSGSVTGVVVGSDGASVPRASLSLRSADLGLVRETASDAFGRFSFGFVTPGAYELRVEALGYRPLVATPVVVNGGDARSVSLTINEAPPPVTSVDSVYIGGAAATAWRTGGARFGAGEIRGFPDLGERLESVASLSPAFDASLGSQGLPGRESVIVADGVPFFRAYHPAMRGEGTGVALFPRAGATSVRALENAPDVEWSGGAGGFVAITTGSTTPENGVVARGAWSGDPLWSTSQTDFEAPSLVSTWGGAEANVDLVPDTSHLFLVADGFRTQLPLAPRLSESGAAALGGLPSELAEALTTASVATTTRFAGLGRLDWWISPRRRFMMRAAAGRLEREFEGRGPAYAPYGGVLPETSTDFSAVAGVTSENDNGLTLELRGGASGSSRVFAPVGDDATSAALVRYGLPLGGPVAAVADVSRFDVFASPVVHYPASTGNVKGGAALRFTKHTATFGADDGRVHWYDDTSALAAERGALAASTSAESSFSVAEFSLFGQYDWEAAPGLHLTVGGRLDVEKLRPQADLDESWVREAGLPNDSVPDQLLQWGGGSSLTWDVGGTGTTTLLAALSIHQGDLDPAMLQEAFVRDGASTTTRAIGDGVDWTSTSSPNGAVRSPGLTLVGPQARAPQSSRISAGIVQKLSDTWSLYVGGAARRTDFLPRRRDLNLPVEPVAVDANGRAVYGTLQKDGALVTSDIRSHRRFVGFDRVWALDTDGFSEYRAVTASLEHHSEVGDLFAAYTHSKTEDNWVGAASALPDAELGPRLPEGRDSWSESVSDFDVPDRLVVGATVRVGAGGRAEISAVYRRSSGLPFTPGYRAGVDANGDGSGLNDVAFVPDAGQLAGLSEWDCLFDQVGSFAARNSCRGPTTQTLDASLRIQLGQLGGRAVRLVIDGLGLVEDEGGVRDGALLLVDPAQPLVTSTNGGTVTVPVTVNPNFGSVLAPASPGRILRVGFRIGG